MIDEYGNNWECWVIAYRPTADKQLIHIAHIVHFDKLPGLGQAWTSTPPELLGFVCLKKEDDALAIGVIFKEVDKHLKTDTIPFWQPVFDSDIGRPLNINRIEKDKFDEQFIIYKNVLKPYAELLKTTFEPYAKLLKTQPCAKLLEPSFKEKTVGGGSKKLENCSCNELREKCKLRKIKGYSGLTKSELIKVLRRK